MSDIDQRIEQRIRAFADELRALLREAAHEALDEALGTLGTVSPTAPRTRSKSSTKKRRPRLKGTRRTNEQMQRDVAALREHIAQHPGHTATQIASAVGMSTRELARPLKKLFTGGDVRKTGVKSHTRYYPKKKPARSRPSPRRSRAKNSRPRR